MWIAKDVQDGFRIGSKTINCPQERAAPLRCCTHLHYHLLDQALVAFPSNSTPQPQAREDSHRVRNPDRSSLRFGIQLISLDLAKIEGALADNLGLNLFGMPPGFEMPIGNRTFVKAKGEHNRRDRAALGQQGQNEQHQGGRMFEIVEHGAGCFGEGFVTGMADVLAFGVRMDADASACATVRLGAY